MSESVKDYLSSYHALRQEIDEMEDRLTALRDHVFSLQSPAYSGLPGKKAPRDPAEDLACLFDLEQSYRHSILEARIRCARIEHLILSLSSPREKQILRARYLDGLSWDEVCGRFLISESLTYSLHKKAISELDLRYGSTDPQKGEAVRSASCGPAHRTADSCGCASSDPGSSPAPPRP